MKIAFFYNPGSGSAPKNPEALREKTLRLLNEFSPGKVRELTLCKIDFNDRAGTLKFCGEYDAVICMGGDGTINYMAGICSEAQKPLCVVPGGSGNGFARSLGLTDLETSLRKLAEGNLKTIDVLNCAGHDFVNVGGVGFDASVANAFKDSKIRGFSGYVLTCVAALFRKKPLRLIIETSQGKQEESLLMAVFANQPIYGFSAVISPGSKPDDGKFELILIPYVRIPLLLILGVFLMTGKILRFPGVRSLSLSDARITNIDGNPTLAHLDGEPVTLPASFEVRVSPQKVRVFC